MSDYHVLAATNDGDNITIAFHIPVPSETNFTGVTLQSALAEDVAIDKTSEVPWIDGAEQTSLTNGSLYEHIGSVRTHKDESNARKKTDADNKFNNLVIRIQNEIRQRYWGWRFERNVP